MIHRPTLGRGGLRAFRHRNYRLFFAGQGLSLVGTWMQTVAQSWLVLGLTGDPFWLGVTAAAQFVPVLFFGLFAGVIADALPKRPTLIVTQVTMMILAFILWFLVATDQAQVWIIVALALLLGIANAVDMPVRQAFAIEMVGREDITNAVALNSAMFNGARIVGPAVAGLVIAATGIAVAFLVNALSFLAAIAGFVFMRGAELHPLSATHPKPTSVAEVLQSLRAGLAYVWRTPLVLLPVTVIGLVATFALNFNVVIPPYAKDQMHTGADGFGFLMTMTGIGSLTAALWIAFQRRSRPILLVGGSLLVGVAEVALAATGEFAVALVLMFILGFGTIAMAATANTMIQLRVPDELRGRVMAVYTTVFAGSTPIGGVILGWVASTAGVSAGMLLGGVTAIGIAGLAAAWLRSAERAGEGARPAAQATPAAIVSSSQRSR